MRIDFKTGTFYQGDCFEVMAELSADSVDMVLNDPPYGTTACAWDSVLPLEQMWPEYWRLLKANGAAVLTASQPFTTTLIASQIAQFRYSWVWSKNLPSGHANANRQPMKSHEDVPVFYRSGPTYNKQETVSKIKDRKLGGSNGLRATAKTGVYGDLPTQQDEIILKSSVSPRSVLEIDCVPRATGTLHPTQKPVALFEYLIRTYTMPGELVLDNTAGSGTTAIAAIQSGRRWICIERDEGYFEKAIARVWDAEAAL